MADPLDEFAAFAQKWEESFPEHIQLRVFQSAADYRTCAAFGAFVLELEQAALYSREAQAAALKLNWWRDEITRAAHGEARHPLARALFADPRAKTLATQRWQAAVDGALRQLVVDVAPDQPTLVAQTDLLAAPLARVEAGLCGLPDSAQGKTTRLWTNAFLLRQIEHWSRHTESERLPWPLDLMARHQLARGDLSEGMSLPRAALVRDQLAVLRTALRAALDEPGTISLSLFVRSHLHGAWLDRLVRESDPLAALARGSQAMPWRILWYAWRGVRQARDELPV